jgi:hypothetical protein
VEKLVSITSRAVTSMVSPEDGQRLKGGGWLRRPAPGVRYFRIILPQNL